MSELTEPTDAELVVEALALYGQIVEESNARVAYAKALLERVMAVAAGAPREEAGHAAHV